VDREGSIVRVFSTRSAAERDFAQDQVKAIDLAETGLPQHQQVMSNNLASLQSSRIQ